MGRVVKGAGQSAAKKPRFSIRRVVAWVADHLDDDATAEPPPSPLARILLNLAKDEPDKFLKEWIKPLGLKEETEERKARQRVADDGRRLDDQRAELRRRQADISGSFGHAAAC